jgi:hypothetical protein
MNAQNKAEKNQERLEKQANKPSGIQGFDYTADLQKSLHDAITILFTIITAEPDPVSKQAILCSFARSLPQIYKHSHQSDMRKLELAVSVEKLNEPHDLDLREMANEAWFSEVVNNEYCDIDYPGMGKAEFVERWICDYRDRNGI